MTPLQKQTVTLTKAALVAIGWRCRVVEPNNRSQFSVQDAVVQDGEFVLLAWTDGNVYGVGPGDSEWSGGPYEQLSQRVGRLPPQSSPLVRADLAKALADLERTLRSGPRRMPFALRRLAEASR